MISAVLLHMSLTTCLQAQPAPASPAPASGPAPSPAAPASQSTSPAPATSPAPSPAAPASPSAPLADPAPSPAAPASPSAPLADPNAAVPTPEGPAAPVVPYTAFAAPPAPYTPFAPPKPRSRFVFAFLPGLTFGINAQFVPSLSAAFFFGGRLRGDRWALGYQFTGAAGLADRYFVGILSHRHHITALTNFGRRGFASIGGGVAFLMLWPAVVELETRVGIRFGESQRGVFGGMVRLGHNFYYREKAPLPQFGLFIGVSLL